MIKERDHLDAIKAVREAIAGVGEDGTGARQTSDEENQASFWQRACRRLIIGAGVVGGALLFPLTAQTDNPLQLASIIPPLDSRFEQSQPSLLLSEADVDRYQRILAAQEAADWSSADRIATELADRRLMGHVLAERYLHPDGYVAGYGEMRDWLAAYADHPEAERVHSLASRRGPAANLASPVDPPGRSPSLVWRLGVPMCPALSVSTTAQRLRTRIDRHRRDGDPDEALDVLTSASGLTTVEYDRLLGVVAAGFYYEQDYEAALTHATRAHERSGGRAELGLWIAGLSHWRDGNYRVAADVFTRLSEAECASAWERSAGAYWAARSFTRAGQFASVSQSLRTAGTYPRTFYGLLARRALGIDIADFAFAEPTVTDAHVRALGTNPAGRRALALLQIGEGAAAEAEFLRVVPRAGDRVLEEALIAVSQQSRLPNLAITVAHSGQPGPGRYYDGALYPLGPWRPEGGFAVEQALIHAIVREESHFNHRAVSWAGASGLMQLMPSTARAMETTDFRPRDYLFDPEYNLTLGQAYILHLLDYQPTGRDLIRILVSYNAGPGSLLGWVDTVPHDDDPLLFIESIPSREARAYAERVMASFWIYRMRLGQPTPSLDDLAAGNWPTYQRLPIDQVAQAWQ